VEASGMLQRHEMVRAELAKCLRKVAIEQSGNLIGIIKMLTFKNAVSRSSTSFDEVETGEARTDPLGTGDD
ncbi:MAG: hypothetical protein ACXWU2_08475, partial [Allosphingosinicella sp.]